MKPMPSLTLATLALLAVSAGAQQAPVLRNAIYASPMAMIINSSLLDFPIISVAYERSLSDKGYSLSIPVHAGYLEDEDEKNVALGLGLGLRKYFGQAFSGTFLALQSDFTSHYFRGERYEVTNGTDQFGNPIWGNVRHSEYDFLSITQLSFGYKWMWRQFTLDLSGGGAFYAQEMEKYTGFIGAANVGFPFSKETFGL